MCPSSELMGCWGLSRLPGEWSAQSCPSSQGRTLPFPSALGSMKNGDNRSHLLSTRSVASGHLPTAPRRFWEEREVLKGELLSCLEKEPGFNLNHRLSSHFYVSLKADKTGLDGGP